MVLKEDKIKFIKLLLAYVFGDLILITLTSFIPGLRTKEVILLVLICIAYSIYVIKDLFSFYRKLENL